MKFSAKKLTAAMVLVALMLAEMSIVPAQAELVVMSISLAPAVEDTALLQKMSSTLVEQARS